MSAPNGPPTGEDLVRDFESCSLAPAAFGHRQHVEVAWHYVRDRSLIDALAGFCSGIQRFAASAGAADKYHETITWALMLVIHERVQRSPPGTSFDDFARTNPDLFEWPSPVLARYYNPETLDSALARKTFLMPDRS